MNTDSFLLRQVYPIVSLIFLIVTSVFVGLLLLRLIFNYTDPNPFGKVGRFSYQLKKRTDKFVYPAARLLAQFRINTKFAPLVTILVTAILAYFLLQIIGNTFLIVDGLTNAIKTNNAKALIGWLLYALVSIYILLIFTRFIGSWFVFSRKTFLAFVYRATDPILLPVQKLIPPVGMFDLSAMIVLLLLGFFADDNFADVCLSVIQFTEKDGALIFVVRVLPKASKSEIVGEHGGALKVKIKSPPVDGAANGELIKVLAKFFDVPKAAVEILKGQTSRTKQIKVEGITAANLPDLNLA